MHVDKCNKSSGYSIHTENSQHTHNRIGNFYLQLESCEVITSCSRDMVRVTFSEYCDAIKINRSFSCCFFSSSSSSNTFLPWNLLKTLEETLLPKGIWDSTKKLILRTLHCRNRKSSKVKVWYSKHQSQHCDFCACPFLSADSMATYGEIKSVYFIRKKQMTFTIWFCK